MRGILDYDNFGGSRKEYKLFVLKALLSKQPTTVIFGPAGVGKTTLAQGKNGKFVVSKNNIFKKADKYAVVTGTNCETLFTRVLIREADKIILLEPEGGEEQILKQRKTREKRNFSKHTDYSVFYKHVRKVRPDAKTCKIRYTGG